MSQNEATPSEQILIALFIVFVVPVLCMGIEIIELVQRIKTWKRGRED